MGPNGAVKSVTLSEKKKKENTALPATSAVGGQESLVRRDHNLLTSQKNHGGWGKKNKIVSRA